MPRNYRSRALAKELRDGDVHNLVVAIAAERNVSIETATALAVEYTNRETDRFLALKARLRSFGPELDEEVRAFVAALESLMRGNLDWSRETDRYRQRGGSEGVSTDNQRVSAA